MTRVGQNPMYTVYIQYFWLGSHQIYGHLWYVYVVWPTLDIIHGCAPLSTPMSITLPLAIIHCAGMGTESTPYTNFTATREGGGGGQVVSMEWMNPVSSRTGGVKSGEGGMNEEPLYALPDQVPRAVPQGMSEVYGSQVRGGLWCAFRVG